MAKQTKKTGQASRTRKARTKKKNVEHIPDEPAIEFLNRDIEWLEFNLRVLAEGMDSRTPLLERVRFMSIVSSNLDEFFMKRVWGIKRQVELGVQRRSGGLTPLHQLVAIRNYIRPAQNKQARYFHEVLIPELANSGIHLLKWQNLSLKEQSFAKQYFKANVFPALTPLAVDPGLPFPFLSNLSTSLGVTLRHPEREEKLFARIKLPKIFPQWIQVRGDEQTLGQFRYVSLLDVVCHNMKDLFPDMEVMDIMPFRITRNGEVEIEEEEIDDLLEQVTEDLKQRRFGEVVRLEHGPNPDPWILQFLMEELELTEAEVFENEGLLDYGDLKPIVDLPFPQHRYEPWSPLVPTEFHDENANIFSIIKRGDVLVHHPYESFAASVERFVKSASEDPKVIAIKMTLYRTGNNSPFIPWLIRAAESGKQVVVLIELKARFDEEQNIHWAHELENAGVHVVYGVMGYKTHAKIALVVRQEGESVHCYTHIGTGNYHKETAKLYTDFGLFTCRQSFTEDVVELFHFLTGRSLKRSYQKLLVAPFNMKDQLLQLIHRETENARANKPARIIAKCNSLEDSTLCRALYQASQAGVKIDLIVRGFCCLRPGVAGMSENIRVISVIGRFLEHSRVFYFQNGQENLVDGLIYIGSADLMYRNLLARIEALVPIEERALKNRIFEVLDVMLRDRRSGWLMNSEGAYTQFKPKDASEEAGTHKQLMFLTKQRIQQEQDLEPQTEAEMGT